MAEEKPIIVIKKKGGHGGHHGGAWKVAYADFVTAMMAFFMVMWLINTADVATKQSIASYFRRPGLFQEGSGTPLMMGQAGILEDAYVPPKKSEDNSGTFSGGSKYPERGKKDQEGELHKKSSGYGEQDKGAGLKGTGNYVLKLDLNKEQIKKGEKGKSNKKFLKQKLHALALELQRAVEEFPEVKKVLGLVQVHVEGESVIMEIMDTEKSSMFKSGSAEVLPKAQLAFSKIAKILSKTKNKIEVIGHTDAIPPSKKGYSNWELSTERALTARRLLTANGVPDSRIVSVVGKAAKEPRNKENPFAPENRRITLKIKLDTPLKEEKREEEAEDNTEKEVKRMRGKRAEGYKPKKIVRAKKQEKKFVTVPKDTHSSSSDTVFSESPVFTVDPFSSF